MKHVILIAVFLCTAWLSQQVYAQQGFGTNAPDRSAAVEVLSTKRGFLIPRVNLVATDNVAPITAPDGPAQSLLVYNLATDGTGETAVSPGFYYWDVTADGATHGAGKWVRFIDTDSEKSTVVAAGNNVTVVPSINGNETTYTVSVAGGTTDDQVLVTVPNPAHPDNGGSDPDAAPFISKWVSYAEFLTELLDVENGLTFDPATGKLEWGGELERATEIKTNGNVLTFEVDPANGGALVIDGLATMPEADYNTARVVVMQPDGTLQAISLQNVIDDLTVTADNGLTMTGNNIQLGGQLNQPTAINTGTTSEGGAAANTLAITGLENASGANRIVVANDANDVLQTVQRVLNYSVNTATTFDIAAQTTPAYNEYAQEVNVYTELPASGNIVLTLPPAATGQVINVKIINDDETHTGEVQILEGGTTLTYGAMPYQGWILKSNGTNWIIVGRN